MISLSLSKCIKAGLLTSCNVRVRTSNEGITNTKRERNHSNSTDCFPVHNEMLDPTDELTKEDQERSFDREQHNPEQRFMDKIEDLEFVNLGGNVDSS